jgi:hypothetical protein
MPSHGTPQVPALGCCCLSCSSSSSHNSLQHGMHVVDCAAARAAYMACWEPCAVQTSLEQRICSCFLHHLCFVCCLVRPLAFGMANGREDIWRDHGCLVGLCLALAHTVIQLLLCSTLAL